MSGVDELWETDAPVEVVELCEAEDSVKVAEPWAMKGKVEFAEL